MKPRIYADFQNLDDENRVRLNTRGTQQDLDRLGLELSDGLELTLCTDDATKKVVQTICSWMAWFAVRSIKKLGRRRRWSSLRHVSDANQAAELNGQPGQLAIRAN